MLFAHDFSIFLKTTISFCVLLLNRNNFIHIYFISIYFSHFYLYLNNKWILNLYAYFAVFTPSNLRLRIAVDFSCEFQMFAVIDREILQFLSKLRRSHRIVRGFLNIFTLGLNIQYYILNYLKSFKKLHTYSHSR